MSDLNLHLSFIASNDCLLGLRGKGDAQPRPDKVLIIKLSFIEIVLPFQAELLRPQVMFFRSHRTSILSFEATPYHLIDLREPDPEDLCQDLFGSLQLHSLQITVHYLILWLD